MKLLKEIYFRLFFLFLFFTVTVSLYSYDLSFKIFRRDTMEPVQQAVVLLTNHQDTYFQQTDDNGFALFEELDGYNYRLSVKAVGYYTEAQFLGHYDILALTNQDNPYHIYLYPSKNLKLVEIEVTEKKNKQATLVNTLDAEELEKTPLGVHSDPINALERFGGVHFFQNFGANESGASTRMVVRGSGWYENAFLFNGLKIPKPYHINDELPSGSVFIDGTVDRLALHKGIAPSEYGQLSSSLVELESKPPSEGFHGKINAGLLNSYALFSIGGLPYDGYSRFAVRRFNMDLYMYLSDYLSLLLMNDNDSNNEGFKINPHFYDLFFQYGGKFAHHRIELMTSMTFENSQKLVSTTNDEINNVLTSESIPKYSFSYNTNYLINLSGILSFSHLWEINSFISMKNHLNYFQSSSDDIWDTSGLSYQSTNINNNELEYSFLIHDKDNDHRFGFNLKNQFLFQFSDRFISKTGLEYLHYPSICMTNYYYQISLNFSNITSNSQNFSRTTNSRIISEVIGGNRFHLSIFSVFFNQQLNLFGDHLELYPGIRFNHCGEFDLFYAEPRFLTFLNLNDDHRLYFSSGIQNRIPEEQDILEKLDSSSNLQPPGILHVISGYEGSLFNQLNYSAEIYYKEYQNRLTPYFSNNQMLIKTGGSAQHIYGYDLSLKWKPPSLPYEGWISAGGFRTYLYYDDTNCRSTIQNFNDKDSEAIYLYTSGNSTFLTYQLGSHYNNISTTSSDFKIPVKQWFRGYSKDYQINHTGYIDIGKQNLLTYVFSWNAGNYYTPAAGLQTNVSKINDISYTNYAFVLGDYQSQKFPDSWSIDLKYTRQMNLFNHPGGFYIDIKNIFEQQEIIGKTFTNGFDEYRYNEIANSFGRIFLFGFWMEW